LYLAPQLGQVTIMIPGMMPDTPTTAGAPGPAGGDPGAERQWFQDRY
jgi:hypothetical protein